MEFSRQEYQSGLPFPSPGDLSNPGIESVSPALQVDSLPLSHREALTQDYAEPQNKTKHRNGGKGTQPPGSCDGWQDAVLNLGAGYKNSDLMV